MAPPLPTTGAAALPPAPTRDVIKVPILGRESIIVGFHLTEYLLHDVLSTLKASTYVLITDSHLAPLYLEAFQLTFDRLVTQAWSGSDKPAPRLLTYTVAPGEQTKSREGKAAIEDFMLGHACTRDTCMLALGGGVIGDLVGYVAATFMRGIPLVQIPTSLLAMVDSSIGGKTAIDTPHGKNLVGAFWQPHRVFIDLHFLGTLPEREFYNGMAEVIKTATIWSESDFSVLENNPEAIRAAVLDSTSGPSDSQAGTTAPPGALESNRTTAQRLLLQVVMGSARVKAEVVSNDERESGLRGLLNFGHTVGHAIEAILSPKLLHGECVAVGMVLESEIARNLGILDQVSLSRLVGCLRAYSLPVSLDDKLLTQRAQGTPVYVADLMQVMRVDKKNIGTTKRLALPCRIGKTIKDEPIPVADEVIATVIAPGVTVLPVPTYQPAPLQNGQEIVVPVPGSKSISNRALVLAAMGSGTCRLQNLLHSDDTQVMLAALQQLGGCQYTWEDNGHTLVVQGGGGKLSTPDVELYLGNAGTAARFLTTLVTLVAPHPEKPNTPTILTGNARMKQRPIGPLVEALRANGSDISYAESSGCLPLRVQPSPTKLAGGTIRLAASISSQYVSSILLCAPYATTEITLELTGGKVISQPYIDMTVAMMRSFGIEVERLNANTYRIPQGVYRNPATYMVESDASSATYPIAVAAITGSCCTIANIGNTSLQGDARFAVDVLRPMGCEVTQTATSTTVRGPPLGSLRPLPSIDMEPMTDAFLTASVLAAVATGVSLSETTADQFVTRITGIANQRVKECNRIAVMVEELGRFGVQASELDDGIQIHARPLGELRGPATGVHCHDDHRVAMSFSVLGCVVPEGSAIQERKCVEKTWPNWWDTLEHRIGVSIRGFDTRAAVASTAKTPTALKPNPEATIVLIGMRGSGKTTLGRTAARALSRPFIDMDQYMEEQLGRKVFDLVNEDGWDAFRVHETRLLKQVLETHPCGTIVACGGGIVETAVGRAVLEDYTRTHATGQPEGHIAPVVQISTSIEHVVAYLSRDTGRPSYGSDVRAVWAKRQPYYAALASYVFPVYHPESSETNSDQSYWPRVEREFEAFLRRITGQVAEPMGPVAGGDASTTLPRFFVSLTLPDLRQAQASLANIVEGSAAVELRVDLLQEHADQPVHEVSDDYIQAQLAWLRHHLPTPRSIIFTVRTQGQGGRFPADQVGRLHHLYKYGLAWGCEFVDIELPTDPNDCRPCLEIQPALAQLVHRRGVTQIIASWHDPQGQAAWNSTAMRRKYDQAASFGNIVKLVSVARSFDDNLALRQFTQDRTAQRTIPEETGNGLVASQPASFPPLVTLNMGIRGQWSRIISLYLTPVTHPDLPVKAAPGQLSIREIHQARSLNGQLTPQQFFLLGTPIAHSHSPAIHTGFYRPLGLPHSYSLAETDNPEKLLELAHQPDFGGASITIPLKQTVIPLLEKLTPEARAIGAVNTIYRLANDPLRLAGDNTDWRGMKQCIERTQWLPPTSGGTATPVSLRGWADQTALVLGAGGTARAAIYALHRLGVARILLFNRTTSRAVELADQVRSFTSIVGVLTTPTLGEDPILQRVLGEEAGAVSLIVSTVPATNFAIDLPDTLFTAVHRNGKGGGGIALDMAYKPRRTPLLVAAARHGWRGVDGVDVLVEQARCQFEIWTRCVAPLVHLDIPSE